MKKEIVFILVCAVVAATAGGGWFYWTQFRTIKGTAADYQIKTLETGEKIVENKKAGLTFQVPEGWTEEKLEGLEGSVIVYSPDTEPLQSKNIKPPLQKGCLIAIATVYKKMGFEELKQEIDDIHFGLGVKSEEFEEITVQNQPALKNTFDTVDIGKGTAVYIPYKNKLYSFCDYAGPEDEEQCLQKFTEFVNNISIK